MHAMKCTAKLGHVGSAMAHATIGFAERHSSWISGKPISTIVESVHDPFHCRLGRPGDTQQIDSYDPYRNEQLWSDAAAVGRVIPAMWQMGFLVVLINHSLPDGKGCLRKTLSGVGLLASAIEVQQSKICHFVQLLALAFDFVRPIDEMLRMELNVSHCSEKLFGILMDPF